MERTIGGAEFYDQGDGQSSLNFEIASTADLSDGVQFSELVGDASAFVLNAREVGTGRYHPALLELNADGTGRILNSNNFGGINPGSGEEVNVDFGEEYIVNLTFDPSLTIIAVPEPGSAAAIMVGSIAIFARRRRLR